MDKLSDQINQGFLDIFSLFSLGMKTTSSTLRFCLLFINMAVPVVILGFYLSKGSFFVSSDALSKATDILEMFLPVGVHIFIMFSHTTNHKMFDKLTRIMDKLNATFKKLKHEKFAKIKLSSTLCFLLKFFIIHIVGCGIESFLLLT